MKTKFFLRPEILFALWFMAQAAATHPSGVIAGRVVDDEGRPMRGIQVQAFALAYRNTIREWTPKANATTNDRGEFRLFWLEPGSYYLAFDPYTPGRTGLGYIPSDPNAGWAITYFPGTSDIGKAEPVQVGVGEIDVHAIPAAALPAHLIRMRITNPALENLIYPLTISIQPVAPTPIQASRSGTTLSLQPGFSNFETRAGLLPGHYRLSVMTRILDRTVAGSTILTIDQGDPDRIDIPVARTLSVQGEVVLNGNAASLKVVCTPTDSNNFGIPSSANVRANGKFFLDNILPGAYSISIDGLEKDAYLSSVRLDDSEVAADAFEFSPDSASPNLTLTVKQDGGSVLGIVIDEMRTAQAGATVVLSAVADAKRPAALRVAVANDQGQFQFRGLAPGTYIALALEQNALDTLQREALLDRIQSNGASISISSGAPLDLGSIPLSKP